jgi:hypothetical protein
MGSELASRERDVLAGAIPSRPDSEPDQLQAIEFAAGEVEFGVREFAGRHVTVANDLDERIHGAISSNAIPRLRGSRCPLMLFAPSVHLADR